MIRPYKDEDFDRLYELEKLCFSSRFRWTKPQFKRHLKGKSKTFVDVSTANQIVGFISLEENYIATIDVDPDVRRCGIGSRLVHAAHDYMREQGYHESSLHVYVKNPSQCLYLTLGYTAVKVAKNFYSNGEHAVYMVKEL